MTTPQWEACKVCGGDHWTKDHTTLEGHRICEENMDAEIARQAAEIATLRAALELVVAEPWWREWGTGANAALDAARAALATAKEEINAK